METFFTATLDDAFTKAGMNLNGKHLEPGRLIRFSTNDRDSSDRAGWAKLFPDENGAVFGCWRTGTEYVWQRRDQNASPPTESEIAAARAKAEENRIAAERERKEQRANAAKTAARIWSGCSNVESHPYLSRKGVQPHGVRIDVDGRLALPVYGSEGHLQSLQFIDPKGEKRFLPGGAMKFGRMELGACVDGEPIVLAEGFATAASIKEATNFPVVVGFSGSNLADVAADLRRRYPKSFVIVAGDRDAHGAGQRYADAAKAACSPSCAVLPCFKDGLQVGDFNDLHQSEGLDAVKLQIESTITKRSRFKLLTSNELATAPPMRWRIRGVLPETGLAAMFGPSGSGKSFLVIDMAQSVASGTEWFGHRLKPCPVVYCSLEGESGIQKRVHAYQLRSGNSVGRVLYLLQPFNLLNRDDVAELASAIRGAGGSGGMVILDTLNRAAPGMDENDSRDMGLAIEAAKALQADIGGLVVFVHHTGKDASKGLRGHSSLHAALDAAIEVNREGGRREWKVYKSKDGEDGIAHPFFLDVVDVGVDEEGEVETSCVIVPQEDTGETIRRALPPKSGNQRIIWDAMDELFRSSASFGEAEAPPGRPCIRLDYAIEKTRARLLCDQKRQTERTQSAITGLVNRGVLVHRDGWLWCP